MTEYSLDWYLLTTMPAQEVRAKMNLQRLGIHTWLAMSSRVAKKGGERRFVERKLFPGYLFLAFECGYSNWLAVRDAPGVYGIIACHGAPLRLPNDLVAELMARCLTGFFDEGQRRIGSKVRVMTGEYAGKVGRIVKAPEEQKVTVMLSACGTPVFQQVGLDKLCMT